MIYVDLGFSTNIAVGPYSGTSPFSTPILAANNVLIAAGSVLMPGGEFLRNAVKIDYADEIVGSPKPKVVASLRRSLEEHADVWAELSKY